ncbi:hypothetical protein Tco_1061331 [Tanacetum coccineum]
MHRGIRYIGRAFINITISTSIPRKMHTLQFSAFGLVMWDDSLIAATFFKRFLTQTMITSCDDLMTRLQENGRLYGCIEANLNISISIIVLCTLPNTIATRLPHYASLPEVMGLSEDTSVSEGKLPGGSISVYGGGDTLCLGWEFLKCVGNNGRRFPWL